MWGLEDRFHFKYYVHLRVVRNHQINYSYHQQIPNYFNEYTRMASPQPNYVPCDIWRPHTASVATPSPLSSTEDEVSRNKLLTQTNIPEIL